MTIRLGISHNNPFEPRDPRAAERRLYTGEDAMRVLAGAKNLQSKTKQEKKSFGDFIRKQGEVIDVEVRSTNSNSSKSNKTSQADPWSAMAASMRVQMDQSSRPRPATSQEEQLSNLAAEVRSLRQDLNRLMARQDRPQTSAADLRQHHPGQLHSFNKNLGYGYQIHPNA